MYVKAAFLRFCEAMVKSPIGHFGWSEEQIRGLYAQCIVDELASRFIQYPSLRVHAEKRYPIARDIGKALPVDIYANFEFKDKLISLLSYGYSERNWIGVKYFGGAEERRAERRTINVASIVKDFGD
jgi:hypothetical protein